MKRFYNLLSLFLLSLVGITNAAAQGYADGDLLTSMDQIVGKNVHLLAPHTASDGIRGYMCGLENFKTSLTDDCLYQFEEVAGETADGYKVYRLKQVSTGLYIKDYDLGTASDEDSEDRAMTANAEEAYKFTSLPAVEGSSNPRETATTAKQDLSQTAFVFARSVFPDTEMGVQYIGHLSTFFWSPYVDTNAWLVYEAEPLSGSEKLASYMTAYYSGSVRPSTTYPGGSTPGTYNEELVNAADAVFDEAQAAYNNYNLTEEQLEDLVARIKSTMDALEDPSAFNHLVEGYYFINSKSNRFLHSNTVNGREFVWATTENSYSVPATLTPNDVSYVWKVTPLEEENNFLVQYVMTGSYMNGRNASLSGMDDGYGFILGDQGAIIIQTGGINGAFNIVSKTKSGATQFHAKFNNNGVMAWNASDAPNNNFEFTYVSEADVLAQLEQAKQNVINNQLSTLISTAQGAYNGGLLYSSPASEGETFDAEGALVTPVGADNEANSNWFSNAKESSEGAYENLFDGDYTTFFHSAWSGGSFTPSLTGTYHYLAANLNEAVSGAVQIKMAKRFNANNSTAIDYPTTVEIFGANNVDKANPDAAEWVDLGSATVDWSIAGTVNDAEQANLIGLATVAFEGSYNSIKMGVLATDQGRGYFALGEANIWQATQDGESDLMQQVPADIKSALVAQIAEAKAKLAANNATSEDVAALQAAYDEFVNNYPDPERVTNLVTEAETFLNNAQNNGLIGEELAQYSADAAAALQTAIDNGKAFDQIDLASINAMVAELSDALAAFKASVILPEAGKYYMIRSLSTKVANESDGTGLNSYRAVVYSPNNATTNNVLRFSRLQGTDEYAEGEDLNTLEDTISYRDDLRYLWKVESAEGGKMVMRNVGTGMYFAARNGAVSQSTEPVEMNMEGVASETFMINAGQNDNGTTVYANAQRAGELVVTWSAQDDLNSRWGFEAIADDQLSSDVVNAGVSMTGGQYRIVTLPFTADASLGYGMAYELLGVSDDNKLVLAEYADVIPAGTPFVFMPEELERGMFVPFGMADLQDEAIEDGGEVNYVFEPVKVDGLKGTICTPDTISTGFGYFNNGQIAITTSDEHVIGVNSGYFDATHLTGVSADEGDATIDLGELVINSIDDSKVVVLPSVVNVYNLNGVLVRKNVKSATATKGLPAGLYIVGGVKMIVK